MPDEKTVYVEGLREFRKAIKDVSDDLPKELRKGLKTIAEVIAGRTRQAFEAGPGVAPKVAGSVKARAQQAGASVQFGGPAVPFAWGAEFGGQRRPTTKQFQPWRGSGNSAGYMFYPTVRVEREHLADDVAELIDRLTHEAFPNT